VPNRLKRKWRTGGTVAGAALLITVVTLASRIVGFGRWLAQAQFLGTGGIDAPFNSANILPNVLFEVAAGGALAGAIVPLVAGPLSRIARGPETSVVSTGSTTEVLVADDSAGSTAAASVTENSAGSTSEVLIADDSTDSDIDAPIELSEAEARAQASQSASALLGWALVILIPLAAITALAAGPIADLLDLGDPTMTRVAAMFLRIFAIQIPIYGVAVVLGGVLQAHRRFFWPAVAPLISSLVVIAVFATFSVFAAGNQTNVPALSNTALRILAWGTTLGVAFLALPLLIPIRDTDLRIRPTLRFPPGEGSRALRLALAGIGALVAQQLSVLVNMRTANSVAGPGAWTVYLYIQQIYLLPYAVLAFPIATSAFPHFTALAAGNRREELEKLVSITTRSLILAMGVGVAALIAAASQIQNVFAVIATGQGVAGLGNGLIWMAPGLFGFALILHLSKVLYAVDAGRAAVTATALGWIVVSALAIVLTRWIGGSSWQATLGALGLANSVGMTVAGIGLLLAVRRRVGAAALQGVVRALLLVAAGVFVGVQLASFLNRWIQLLTGNYPSAAPTSGVLRGVAAALVNGVLAAILAVLGVALVSLLDPALRRQLTGVVKRFRSRAVKRSIG